MRRLATSHGVKPFAEGPVIESVIIPFIHIEAPRRPAPLSQCHCKAPGFLSAGPVHDVGIGGGILAHKDVPLGIELSEVPEGIETDCQLVRDAVPFSVP